MPKQDQAVPPEPTPEPTELDLAQQELAEAEQTLGSLHRQLPLAEGRVNDLRRQVTALGGTFPTNTGTDAASFDRALERRL